MGANEAMNAQKREDVLEIEVEEKKEEDEEGEGARDGMRGERPSFSSFHRT